MLWGFSSALDLIQKLKMVMCLEDLEEINILLLGSVDSRHILKTISKHYIHDLQAQVSFYIMDEIMELVSREMLLCLIALEPPEKLGLVEKARVWMEVYGNTLMRAQTAQYVIDKAAQLIHVVTNKEYQKKRIAAFNLEHLKYIDIDRLENIYQYWTENKLHITLVWDAKLRSMLKTRYDSKMGVFDWDYNMNLVEIPLGKRVDAREYKQWRNTGVAFRWLETEYSIANPTLALGVSPDGDQLLSYGYMGDMESGPFYGFALDCEEESFTKTINGLNAKRSTDIMQRHLERMFHEILTNSPYDPPQRDDDRGIIMMPIENLNFEEEIRMKYKPDRKPEEYSSINIPQKIIFLPSGASTTHPKKDKFKNFFHIIFVAQNFFGFFQKDIIHMAKPGCALIFETRKFVLSYDKAARAKFGEEIKSQMKELNCQQIWDSDFCTEDHAMFKVHI